MLARGLEKSLLIRKKLPAENENTPLTASEGVPQYLFQTNIARQRRQRVYEFQCCIGTILLCIFLVALIIVITYNLNGDDVPNNLEPTVPNNETDDNLQLLTSVQFPIEDGRSSDSNVIELDESQLNDTIEYGKRAVEDLEKFETVVPKLDVDTPSYRHQRAVATSEKANSLSKLGYAEYEATKYVSKKYGKAANSSKPLTVLCKKLRKFLDYPDICNRTHPKCDEALKYRSFDGSCNNLKHPYTWGVALTPFRRSLPADYADGIGEPRRAKNGDALPSARKLSLEVHRPYYRDDPKFSVMLAVWGQFLDHDITATALSHGANGSAISCCGQKRMHPECFPVTLDETDPNFRKYNVTCMEFVRSAPAPTCSLGPRQQLNQVSAYIDGSVVYGPDEESADRLRTMEDGTMKVYVTVDNRTLLPFSEDTNDGCNRKEQMEAGRYCFETGDARANENLHLTTMHLVWVRQHNFIAESLQNLNRNWTDERLYQEVRKILAAQMQHITYAEFLIVLLGPSLMDKLSLSPMKQGYYHGYDPNVDASIANDFAAAGFRFAHTLIPALMKFFDKNLDNPEYMKLHEMLFDPFKLYNPGDLDRTLRGAMYTHLEAADQYFNSELQQHLFQKDKMSKLCGLDLVSLNIQRGRDHGLAAYSLWRERCGLQVPRTFQDLGEIIDDDSLNRIQSLYKSVDDIDLYTGALSERPLSDGMLGPTITCIITDQFVRLKRGDRFWYENPGVFSREQLREIRKSSLARVICDNADNVQEVPRLAMQRSKLVNCKDIPQIDFSFWKSVQL